MTGYCVKHTVLDSLYLGFDPRVVGAGRRAVVYVPAVTSALSHRVLAGTGPWPHEAIPGGP